MSVFPSIKALAVSAGIALVSASAALAQSPKPESAHEDTIRRACIFHNNALYYNHLARQYIPDDPRATARRSTAGFLEKLASETLGKLAAETNDTLLNLALSKCDKYKFDPTIPVYENDAVNLSQACKYMKEAERAGSAERYAKIEAQAYTLARTWQEIEQYTLLDGELRTNEGMLFKYSLIQGRFSTPTKESEKALARHEGRVADIKGDIEAQNNILRIRLERGCPAP